MKNRSCSTPPDTLYSNTQIFLCATVSIHLSFTSTLPRFIAIIFPRQTKERERYLVILTIRIVSFITENGYVTARGLVVSRY